MICRSTSGVDFPLPSALPSPCGITSLELLGRDDCEDEERGGGWTSISFSDEPLIRPAIRKLEMELAREELGSELGTDTDAVGGAIKSGEEQMRGSSTVDIQS